MASYVKDGRKHGTKRKITANKWFIRVGCGYNKDGSIRRKSETFYGTEREADRRIEEIYMEMSENPTLGSGYTLDEYFRTRFLPGRSDLTKQTLDFHKNMWKHVPEKWKNSELQEQPHATVQRWINSLAPGVAHHAMRTYRAVLRAAWYDDLLTDEPFKKPFRYPRKKASKLDVWSAYEVSQSIEKLRGDSLYGIFLCMAGAGLRREEGLALNWEDIDFIPFEQDEKGNVLHWMARIKVFDAFTELDGEKATKTADSFRIVSLAPVFANPLHSIAHEDGPVCKSRHNRRMSASQLPKHWKGLWREGYPLEGLTYIPINRLRHTNTTLMHEAEVSDFTISRTRGHKSLQMAYDHYLAPSSKQADMAALAVGQLIEEESVA